MPLGTPLLAGPGAIVATMLFVQRVHGAGDGFALAAAMAAVALVVWLAMRFLKPGLTARACGRKVGT